MARINDDQRKLADKLVKDGMGSKEIQAQLRAKGCTKAQANNLVKVGRKHAGISNHGEARRKRMEEEARRRAKAERATAKVAS